MILFEFMFSEHLNLLVKRYFPVWPRHKQVLTSKIRQTLLAKYSKNFNLLEIIFIFLKETSFILAKFPTSPISPILPISISCFLLLLSWLFNLLNCSGDFQTVIEFFLQLANCNIVSFHLFVFLLFAFDLEAIELFSNFLIHPIHEAPKQAFLLDLFQYNLSLGRIFL